LSGDGIDAIYPVLRTCDIGNVGTICCSDGEYPEAVRALAFNGTEVVYRPSEGGADDPGGPRTRRDVAAAEDHHVGGLPPGRVTVFIGSSRHSRRFCTPAADPDVIADERRAAP
jgi:beta-ureidopropionase